MLALECIMTRRLVAEFGRAHRAPADAVARAVEAAEGAFQPRHMRKQRILANLDPVHHDLAGDRGAQGYFPLDFRRRQALQALFQDEPPDRSEEHTSELQSLMRISYAVFCLKKKTKTTHNII